MSESLWTITFITLSGGLQDAYTYFSRNRVFANAQTGNIVLMASHLMDGDLQGALRYFVPLLFFACGIFTCEQIDGAFHKAKKLHWRQIVIFIEITLLFSSGFLSEKWNLLAVSMVSFACAMQVQAFRRIKGYGYASTMCIGNIRAGVSWLSKAIRLKDKTALHHAGWYFFVILVFTAGAAGGCFLVKRFHLHAIWFSCILLAVALILMFIQYDLPEK